MIPARVGVVDDHTIFRQGLRKLFDDQAEFCVVGEASNGAEAIDLVNRIPLDILLLDLQLGDMTGLEVLRRIGPNTEFQTILLGADIEQEAEVHAILLGASGVVRKYAAAETLFQSIRSILEGEIWVKRVVMKELVGIFRESRSLTPSGGFGLTPREADILDAVVQGQGNKEISETLGISPFTVKHYLTRIFNKLKVTNRVELVLFATRNGLTRPSAVVDAAGSTDS
jgi:DNA-binding NarL/FixJ family response regulator